MTPAETDRKIRQLDNDVQSIYVLLNAISSTQGRHGNRLDELGEDVARLDAKVTELDAKVTGLDSKVTGLDAKMDTVLELLRAR